ncbi:TetR/AcrR family transcriptional regulator [Vibrio mytili]|uniref:TetR/AcrR family transcriptional regulator n=1 Tax=Vibrio mytili TaxID=50718 RepID=UPI003C6EADDE
MSTPPTGDKREQILTATEKLIAESGFQGLSMQKLANEAGVAAGTIYRYFADKEILLEEVRLHVAKRIATAMQAGVSDEMPLKERYRTMWLNVWHFTASNLCTISNRAQYQSLPRAETIETQKIERQLFAQVDRFFDQGKEQDIFKPLDNDVLAGLSFEACSALARRHAFGFYHLDDDALEAAIEASWDAIIKH